MVFTVGFTMSFVAWWTQTNQTTKSWSIAPNIARAPYNLTKSKTQSYPDGEFSSGALPHLKCGGHAPTHNWFAK